MGWTKPESTGDNSWISVSSFGSGWVEFGTPTTSVAYRKDGQGFVHLQGTLKSGTVSTSVSVFTLPPGYRPSGNKYWAVQADLALGTVEVHPDGTVYITSGSNSFCSLDPIQFYGDQ